MDPGTRADAQASIANLLSLYYQALDQGDLETLGREVIDEEATWVLVQLCGDERVVDESTGRDTILDWFRRMYDAGVSMTEGTVRHYINTHVIEVKGETATSTSHLQAIETAGMTNVASGFVRAEHVLGRDGWRIRRYEVEETITRKDMDALKATFHSDD